MVEYHVQCVKCGEFTSRVYEVVTAEVKGHVCEFCFDQMVIGLMLDDMAIDLNDDTWDDVWLNTEEDSPYRISPNNDDQSTPCIGEGGEQ